MNVDTFDLADVPPGSIIVVYVPVPVPVVDPLTMPMLTDHDFYMLTQEQASEEDESTRDDPNDW